MLIIAFVFLPFVFVTVTNHASGITRPLHERTEIKPYLSGILDTLYYREGDTIPQNAILARLKDPNTASKALLSNYELQQRRQFIYDLGILTTSPYLTVQNVQRLQSPVYRQQITRFLYQRLDQEASLRKVRNEVRIDSILAADKVIAPKEMFDKITEQEKLQAAYFAFKSEQLAVWQGELARYRLELSQLEAGRSQLEEERRLYEIRSPIGGVVQGLVGRYPGGTIQSGETLCAISPEGELIAECYVPTRDVGLLKLQQPVRFQVDAFDYNFFGVLTGRVVSIDNDFTVMEGKPVFKVRCSFDATQLHLKNGYTGSLKKGLTFQARFVVARRSLWQLLFDKVDDWLNPAGGATQ